ncbi:tRNA uridine(34) 5-carboxymethylaminomethyl modification radical SAM/GNAT enzyme Elp3 [Patescibacteria group bacterium]|nr:tRNA uridine(34) 5-carboxymethylaminomethyl modification radical SAM/GNAT enzyme Elp3 [Patescibacteria group bacterium]MBU1931762.1 tRNA uridine(34) 5-carboxymethylaminomethyl modification radical SAM/GNAT enzyme Elp3 [Patescibacteria group bacterium]
MDKTTILVYQFLSQKPVSDKNLLALKKMLAKKTGQGLVKNSEILRIYRQLVKQGKLAKNLALEEQLCLKKTRTLSGVAPVAVLTRPYPCPGKCVYCPNEPGIPQSYLSLEPAVERAKAAQFDPYLQVKRRLKQYRQTGHQPEKIELIVIGGSFSALPGKYKRWFIKRCFEAANQQVSPTLLKAQKVNEASKYRIIGITLETRPDMVNLAEIKLMRQLGATRVEIGVQNLDDRILKLVKRGHGQKASIKATRLLKDAGFKVCYHMMPNLPGSSLVKDRSMFKQLFSDQYFKPDMLKIYPCVVLKEAPLYQWYKDKRYQAYRDKDLLELLVRVKTDLPRWVRLNRLIRDIPKDYIIAGTKVSNLRQVLVKEMQAQGLSCQCVRCREARNLPIKKQALSLKISQYEASGGQEYFLEFVDVQDRLYGLLRLRLVKKNRLAGVFPVLSQAALVRELHVFGQALALEDKQKLKIQHKGLGAALLKRAETISRKNGFKKLAIISGVGAREYYQRFGYRLEQTYMLKELDNKLDN